MKQTELQFKHCDLVVFGSETYTHGMLTIPWFYRGLFLCYCDDTSDKKTARVAFPDGITPIVDVSDLRLICHAD